MDGNGKRWTLRSDEHGMNMFDMSSSFFGYVLEMDGIQSDSDFPSVRPRCFCDLLMMHTFDIQGA